MKPLGLTLTAFLFLVLHANAQNPTPAAALPGPDRLDALLKAWEERMGSIDNFSTKVTRTDVDALTKRTKVLMGEAAFMKPNLARIDLTPQDEVGKKDAEKTNFERIFCDGNYIYQYSPKEKLIVVHEIPKNNPADDNMILSFMRGMKAANAKQRFDLQLTKETEWYAYLMITPKNPGDQQEFTMAQMTIWLKNPNPQGQPNLAMMPCRLWYRQPSGKEVTYMFSDMQPNGNLGKSTFVPRQIEGYKVETASAKAAPPAPRSQGPNTVREQRP